MKESKIDTKIKSYAWEKYFPIFHKDNQNITELKQNILPFWLKC